MNDFQVTFADGLSSEQIDGGIDAVPASVISTDGLVYTIEADWGTTPEDLASLKHCIEYGNGDGSEGGTGPGSVISIDLPQN